MLSDIFSDSLDLHNYTNSILSDDGKPVGEANTDEFWNLFGGFAPIGKRATSEDDSPGDSYAGKLYM